MKLPTYKY